MNDPKGPNVFAVVPVKDLRETKSRLEPVLAPAARAGLTLYMLDRVLAALRGTGVENVGVVSPDPVVLERAESAEVFPLPQESRGLNPALEEGRRWAVERGADALLVLPADLPLVEASDVRAVLDASTEAGSESALIISPDAARAGTNAFLLRPPDAVPFLFGPGSFEAHQRSARERGVEVVVRERPRLAFDLDTAEDLARLGPQEESAS